MFSITNNRMIWKNWSESVHCEPEQYVEPENISQLQTIVRQANQARRNIRVVGAGHSFTPLVATSEIMVSLRHLVGIDSIDRNSHYVTVWGGTNLKELGKQLWEQGYAMENLGDINKQTIAGAISTGTHGTGIQFGSISTQVVGMSLLQANGDILEINEASEGDLLQAAQVSLGMLGIIIKVTLKVLPAYQLMAHSYRLSLEDSLQQLPKLLSNHRNMEFYWFPYTNTVQIKTLNVATSKIKPIHQKRHNMFKKVVIENGLFWMMSEVSRIVPRSAKAISTISAIGIPVGAETNASHELFATPRLVKFQEMEYSVPVDHLEAILRLIDATIRKEQYAVHFPIECRFVQADNSWLSPSYERDSAYIAIHMYKGMEFSPYFQTIENILKQFEGRPHWGKMHTMNKQEIQAIYPRLDDFNVVRRQLDERGIFLNEYLSDLFS